MIKQLSLTVKIWLAITMVIVGIYLVVLVITPPLIHNFFTDTLMNRSGPPPHEDGDLRIRSFILLANGETLPADARQSVPTDFLAEIKVNAVKQEKEKNLYETHEEPNHIRYVIEKGQAYGQPLYQVMFLKEPEEDFFVKELLFNIMMYLGLTLVGSWFATLLIVRYLTRPLTVMEQHVKRIANRNWHEPLNIKRNDEIGKLATSINTMRQHLIQQDDTQQSMLQNISHELKTPVMVIRSYAQAILDGIYPKGDLAGSIKVIDEEGERLEKLVQQLLYLTRLDYLATQNAVLDEIQLNSLIGNICHRLNVQRPEISWHLQLQPLVVNGDEDMLRVMIENLLDNHLRYAVSRLEISVEKIPGTNEIQLKIWNDGSAISDELLAELGRPFNKGRKGKFGLGLTIVQRTLKIYRGRFEIKNERDGVASMVTLPILEGL